MSMKRRPFDSLFRQRRNARDEGRDQAAALTRRAGRGGSGGGEPGWFGVETLEERRLLFTLTVTADSVDPLTGLGSAVTHFGYVVPFLTRMIPDPIAADVVNEEFEDEMALWTTFLPPAPPSGTFFEQSEIRVTYSTLSQTPIIRQLGPDGMMMQDQDMAITLSTNDNLSFEFWDGVMEGNPEIRLASQALVTVAGLNEDALAGTRIELFREGAVVRTILGAGLTAIRQAVVGGFLYTLTAPGGFESFRFSSAALPPDNATYFDNFIVDDIAVSFPAGRFAAFNGDRVFGAEVVLTGPVGASIQVVDLYGRDMRETIRLGVPDGSMVALVDRNDDGIPDFNDGIGRITFSGSDNRTALTMIGGNIMAAMMPSMDSRFFAGGFDFTLPDMAIGLLDAFESAGFGYDITNMAPPMAEGVPPGAGSIIIGSPFIRTNTTQGAYLAPLGVTAAAGDGDFLDDGVGSEFVRADQGIMAVGQSVAAIDIHGIMHGSSVVGGSLGRWSVGVMLGSLSVEGDLGMLTVAGDSGLWVTDTLGSPADPAIDPDPIIVTGSQIIVGRTAGQIHIGARSVTDIQILGDINNPERAILPVVDYTEQEVVYFVNNPANANERTTLTATLNRAIARAPHAVFFGAGYFRNDSILSSEFIGVGTSALRLSGELVRLDPVNTGRDASDVFAFAADPSTPVTVDVDFLGNDRGYARIVDSNGRVLASAEVSNEALTRVDRLARQNARFVFQPDHIDVYYLQLWTPVAGGLAVIDSLGYNASISGMRPVTMGTYRSGARTGLFDSPNVISVQSGNVGSIRVGVGYVGGDGNENDTTQVQNNSDDVDDLLAMREVTISTPGTIYNITAGGDVVGFRFPEFTPGTQIFVGGNLGSFITGASAVIGIGPTEGDVEDLLLEVGGTIGLISIGGAVRFDNDNGLIATDLDIVSIKTGRAGGRGDIGSFLVGGSIDGTNFTVETSPGSTIDTFLVGVGGEAIGIGGDGTERGNLDEATPRFFMGSGSNLRFATFDTIENVNDPDAFQFLLPGQPVTVTDDAGGRVTIAIVGGAVGSSGQIFMLPIDGSQGVAIARIAVNLVGGANLVITGSIPGEVSIGRIVVQTDGGAALSSVILGGVAEIDVWRIDQIGGNPLAAITNSTAGGDIVAIDAIGLNRLEIARGNLGRTQTNGIGPALIGPFLGVEAGFVGAVGGALGVNAASLNGSWNGTVFMPVNQQTSNFAGDLFLEDIGGPFDGRLDGLVVRTGNVQQVLVSGSVGDVILQGGAGVLVSLTANTDRLTVVGGFDGIVGSIYARDIGTIDVGDGLLGPGPNPLAAAGIFADDDITAIVGGRGLNPIISGMIVAADNVQDFGGNPDFNGILAINLTGGGIRNAFIGSATFDTPWISARFHFPISDADDPEARGSIVAMRLTSASIFRSEIYAVEIRNIVIVGGAYDATSTVATSSITSITADEFRNSTLGGEPAEFWPNEIRATENITLISTHGLLGDLKDLLVDAQGSILDSIAGRNFVRVELQIDGELAEAFANGDIRASTFVAGRIVSTFAIGDIRSSEFNVAGPILSIIAGENITSTSVNATGPDGQIALLQSRFFLTGEVSSSGPIGTIRSTEGDVIAFIRTTETDGSLALLQAGRDLIVTVDIDGDAAHITAGRHIGILGEPAGLRTITIDGNLGTISAPNGQIYTDVRVAQAITGSIQTGRVVSFVGNDQVSTAAFVAFGRINFVNIAGDFDGVIRSESGGIGAVRITDGSLRPGSRIEARDGSIDSVTITGGHLMGDIIAEETIGSVQIFGSAAGFFGDIGVNPGLSRFLPFDAFRGQLPPDAVLTPTFQGPRIQAGAHVGLVHVDKASMWESSIVAGHSVGRVFIAGVVLNDNITPGLGGSYIIAGDAIGTVDVGAFAGGMIIGAGVTDLGDDDRPGGTGANTDTVQFGRIGDLIFRGGTGAVSIFAGLNAGPDGQYTLNPGPDGVRGTADDINDDLVANGLSAINSVTVFVGAFQTTVYADNGIGFTSPGIIRGGPGLGAFEPNKVIEFVPPSGQIPAGGAAFATSAGESGFISLTGPGQAYWDQSLGRLALINTTLASNLVVTSNTLRLTDFTVISNDGSSLNSASIRANLFGNSNFYFDGYVAFAEFGGLDMTGSIGAGNDIGTLIVGPVARGNIDANYINSIIVGGDLGSRSITGEAAIRVLAAGSILIGGRHHGLISSQRDIAVVNIAGDIDRAAIRAGRSIGTILGARLLESRISARNDLTVVRINGEAFDSFIYAGADLGSDGTFGGSGSAADVVSNGNIGSLVVNGNFRESDVAAGISRGADGFLGTPDDGVDEGRSNIGPVTIAGNQVGSQFNSESYRIVSNGAVAQVFVGGQPFTSGGNFRVDRVAATPAAVRVADVQVVESGRVYTARITFNQPVDRSTISAALNIFEVRSGGAVTIRLSENVDYTVQYDPATSTALVLFTQAVTQRSLPQANGVPGPGTYRFVIDADILRGQTQTALLDGDGDGVAEPGDDFSSEDFVGDAGDKLTSNTVVVDGRTIDFYAASDLDLVLDNNQASDGLPDVNRTFTVRGSLGDHPDQDINVFRTSGDADVYRLTLRAGQILRIGALQGVARGGQLAFMDSTGQILSGTSALVQQLPADPGRRDDITFEQQFLIKQTGTFLLAVGANFFQINIADPNAVANLPAAPGATGPYNFTVRVFDDSDTGFSADTDSGDGVAVVNAPVPGAFAGTDGGLNTADDLASVASGLFVFTLNPGADGVKGTADDLVSGSGGGITSQRTAGSDGLFGTSDDRLVSFVAAAIGEGGGNGVSGAVTPDIDVYHLNNRQPLLPGSRVRVTLQLTELGSNFGFTPDPTAQDLRGNVQFAVFETSGSFSIEDAILIAAPSDALPVGGTPNTTVSDGVTTYGYDATGDFFIDFVVPDAQGQPDGTPGTFALYVQGALRSDYTMEILNQGTATFTRSVQNVLLEIDGGDIDWLEAGTGVLTRLGAFNTSVLGFSGMIGNRTVDQYVLDNLVAALDAIFLTSNVDIRVATDPSAFEGEDFSTVFVTATSEPFAFFGGFSTASFLGLLSTVVLQNPTFGASEHTDLFNADRNDQAVVFVPALGPLGNPPGIAGVDNLVQSLTAAVSRRIGELVGLRILDGASAPISDPMGADSVQFVSPFGYSFSAVNSSISTNFDGILNTNFFLGQQNSFNLLGQILADRF